MPDTSISQFENQLKAFEEKVKKRSDFVLRSFVSKLTDSLIDNTPVVTGRMKASWYAGHQASIRRQHSPDPDGSSTKSRVANQISRIKVGRTVYIINNAMDEVTGFMYPVYVEFTNLRYGIPMAGRPRSRGFARRVVNVRADRYLKSAVREARKD